MSSWPKPACAWIDVSRTICVLPMNHAAADVIMNRVMVVRRTGTPTLVLAVLSPPTAKIQLPKRVFSNRYEAPMVTRIHHTMATWNFVPAIVMVLAMMACRIE